MSHKHHFFGLICILILISCSKKKIDQTEVIDYRLPFIGDYSFQIIQYNWIMGQTSTYDTSYYKGNIQLFKDTDSETDMSAFDNDTEMDSRRLTIHFNNSLSITPEIKNTGEFIKKNGYHYGQSGEFITKDSVSFFIGGLGGLGGGSSYTVRGQKL
jgi:hypothetical protein